MLYCGAQISWSFASTRYGVFPICDNVLVDQIVRCIAAYFLFGYSRLQDGDMAQFAKCKYISCLSLLHTISIKWRASCNDYGLRWSATLHFIYIMLRNDR